MKNFEIFKSLDFAETGDFWVSELPVGPPLGPFSSYESAEKFVSEIAADV